MTVNQLIKYLLDQPEGNKVYVAGLDPITGGIEWDGKLEDVTGGQPGNMTTYLTFNETGLNSLRAIELDEAAELTD